MIKSLSVQNFQSHRNSYLEFSPGVNVIVGPSDSGKTAVIRALRWLIWNRPQGSSFCSVWGGHTKVKLELDKHSIARIKADDANLYFLDGNQYQAIRTDVPKEIQETININEINLQQQLDAPFLLSASPGEVAQHFNRIAHLDIIDISLSNLQRWIREIEQTISYKSQEAIDKETDLKQYNYLEDMEGCITILEWTEGKKISLCKKMDGLKYILSSLVRIKEETNQYNNIMRLEKLVSPLLLSISERDQRQKKLNALQSLIYQLQSADRRKTSLSKLVVGLPLLSSVLANIEKRKESAKKYEALKSIILRSQQIFQLITKTKLQLHDSYHTFSSNFPPICPLCGQEVKHNA